MENHHHKCDVEITLKYFDSARSNIITRLAARDNCILLYLAAVAGVMTAALTGNTEHYEAMLVLPLVAMAVAAFVAQHNFVMDVLYIYIAKNINEPLRERGITIVPWETSDEYANNRLHSTGLRLRAEAVIILAPAAIGLSLCAQRISSSQAWMAFYLSAAALLVTILIIRRSMTAAKQHLADLNKIKSGNKLTK